MLTYARWVVLMIMFVAVFITGMRIDYLTLVSVGVFGVLLSGVGMFIDVFRDRKIRSLEEELIIHRRHEAHRRNINQRRTS